MAAARRRNDDKLVDALFEFLVAAPWWVGPPVAGLFFSIFRWMIPLVLSATPTDERVQQTLGALSNFCRQFAPIIGAAVLMLWLSALGAKFVNRRRLDSQTGLDSVRDLRWDEFEALLAEAFRRQDYRVQLLGGNRPDGGVDIALEKNGEVTLVQCKHWRQRRVGVKVVREILGSVANARAQRGIVVTSGSFTPDAEKLARNNSIQLIDGPALERMVGRLQKSRRTGTSAAPLPANPTDSTPACPKCNSQMVLRKAKRGPHAGSSFWGCTRYPACRGIRQMATP